MMSAEASSYDPGTPARHYRQHQLLFWCRLYVAGRKRNLLQSLENPKRLPLSMAPEVPSIWEVTVYWRRSRLDGTYCLPLQPRTYDLVVLGLGMGG